LRPGSATPMHRGSAARLPEYPSTACYARACRRIRSRTRRPRPLRRAATLRCTCPSPSAPASGSRDPPASRDVGPAPPRDRPRPLPRTETMRARTPRPFPAARESIRVSLQLPLGRHPHVAHVEDQADAIGLALHATVGITDRDIVHGLCIRTQQTVVET